MIEAMLIGLQFGIICALLDHAAQWTTGELVEKWGEFARGLLAGSFMFGPPVILAWWTSQTVDWLVAVTVTWTVLALSSRDLRDWARRS